MNIKKILFLLLITVISHPVYAGSSDAVIQCKSGSGRTTLTFLDQDIQGHFQGGTFTIDKKSIQYLPQYNSKTNKNNPYSWMTVNMKEGVYTLVYNDNKNFLNFYALPSTMKKKKKEGKEAYYTFNGIVEWRSSDPRSTSILRKKIWLGCTLSYSI
ncbi:MAG: hypothetical protein KAH22_02935 [Thiotrichaceae bacterium]|nr:hypothetical protein [Thiotrichaceae bacterium]